MLEHLEGDVVERALAMKEAVFLRVPGVAVGSKNLLVICKSYRKSMNISLFTQLLDRLSIYIYIYIIYLYI